MGEAMNGRLCCLAIPCLALAAPASGEERVDPERALYLAYRARAEAMIAEAEAKGPPPYQQLEAPLPMEIRTGGGSFELDRPAAAERPANRVEPSEPSSGSERPAGCMLPRDGSDGASPRQCLGCHGASIREHTSHPVEVDYEAGGRAASGMGSLRPLGEAVRRGAFLPDGKVRCVSCHSGRSRWRYRLAIPADAEVRPAVHPGDARTYESAFPAAVPAAAGFSARQRAAMLPDGFEVGVKPLCLSCHPMD